MQALLGLQEPALQLYRAVLRRPDDEAATLAAAADVDPADVPALLAELLERRLVREDSASGRLVPARPDAVLEPLLADEQRALAERQERLAELRSGLTDLVELYVSGVARTSGPVEVERVEGRVALQARLTELSAAATSELLTIGVTADIGPEQIPQMRESDRLSWSRGARSRVLLPTTMRSVDHLMAYALEASSHGDEYRVLAAPPMTLVVFDRHVGLVPIDQDHLASGAYVVWSPAIVAAFAALFELAWQTAEPVFSPRVQQAGHPALDARSRQLLELLGSGAKDEAVARQLGLGLRTVRRDAARLMDQLGARTRFAAGAEAARRGWL